MGTKLSVVKSCFRSYILFFLVCFVLLSTKCSRARDPLWCHSVFGCVQQQQQHTCMHVCVCVCVCPFFVVILLVSRPTHWCVLFVCRKRLVKTFSTMVNKGVVYVVRVCVCACLFMCVCAACECAHWAHSHDTHNTRHDTRTHAQCFWFLW